MSVPPPMAKPRRDTGAMGWLAGHRCGLEVGRSRPRGVREAGVDHGARAVECPHVGLTFSRRDAAPRIQGWREIDAAIPVTVVANGPPGGADRGGAWWSAPDAHCQHT